MVCFHPVKMFWTREFTDNGKKKLVPAEYWNFNRYGSFPDEPETEVCCNKCLGCRMNRARSNAVRLMDEASLFQNSCFITLTVGDRWMEQVFPGRSLCRRAYQLFAYRFNQRFSGFERVPKPFFYKANKWNDHPVRIVYCGEYGSLDWRPHFHAILMNFDFEDKQRYGTSDNGSPLYLSQSLMDLWSDPVTGECYGRCDVGDVNADSCAYLAGYVLKKQRQIEFWTDRKYRIIEPEYVEKLNLSLPFSTVPGLPAETFDFEYTVPAVVEKNKSERFIVRPDTGELLSPPFVQYPSHFGLGRLWYERFGYSDVYNDDRHQFGGKFYPVPRYYDKRLQNDDPFFFDEVCSRRRDRALQFKKSDEELKRLEEVFECRQKRSEERKKI